MMAHLKGLDDLCLGKKPVQCKVITTMICSDFIMRFRFFRENTTYQFNVVFLQEPVET